MKISSFVILVCSSVFFAAPVSASPFKRIIVFGDSLSDMGTYAQSTTAYNGGKFTTNPGKLWIEIVADHLNLPLQVNREEGLGQPLKIIGGFNYAQGGARVTVPATDPVHGVSARPISEQVDFFLKDNTKFNADDVVFIQGGANDIFAQLRAVSTGAVTPAVMAQNIATAAGDFVQIVKRIQAAGAGEVIVVNLPQVELTPMIVGYGATAQSATAQMVDAFDGAVQQGIGTSHVALVDLHSFDQKFNANYTSYGFVNITDTACNLKRLPASSAMYCSASTLIAPGTDMTYKFADGVHPTTGMSKVIGDFVYGQISVP